MSANIKFSKIQLCKMVQLEGILMPGDIMGSLPKLPKSIMNSYAKKLKNMNPKELINKGSRYIFANAAVDNLSKKLKEGIPNISGSGITLPKDDIKDIIKVISSLENRGTLSKETIRKITSLEGGFLNFLKPLIATALPLMKNALIPLAKCTHAIIL